MSEPRSIDVGPATDKFFHDRLQMSGDAKAYTSDKAAFNELTQAFLAFHQAEVQIWLKPVTPDRFIVEIGRWPPTSASPEAVAAFRQEFRLQDNEEWVIFSRGCGSSEALAGCRAFYAYIEKASLEEQYKFFSPPLARGIGDDAGATNGSA